MTMTVSPEYRPHAAKRPDDLRERSFNRYCDGNVRTQRRMAVQQSALIPLACQVYSIGGNDPPPIHAAAIVFRFVPTPSHFADVASTPTSSLGGPGGTARTRNPGHRHMRYRPVHPTSADEPRCNRSLLGVERRFANPRTRQEAGTCFR